MKKIIYVFLKWKRELGENELQIKFNIVYLLATISATHGVSVFVEINGVEDPISIAAIAIVFVAITTGFYFRAELLNKLLKITKEVK